MSFLAPLFLIGGLAAAIPVILHLLKREPDARVKFSAVRLLLAAPVENTKRRHLRELILLALRVTALLMLAFAFARPFFTSGSALTSSSVTIVALDTSLSMSAPGQFEKARQLAKQAIDRPGGGLVGVVTFDDEARVVSEVSADKAMARAAVDAASPGAGATSYRGALTASADLLHGRQGTLVIVTDLQETGWDSGDRVSLPESAQIEVVDVGAPPPNFAVTSARLLPGDRVAATIRNLAPSTRDAHVVLQARATDDPAQPGTRAGETTVPIGANQSADVTFPAPRGRWASVVVDDPQGASRDNVRYLILDSTARPTVLIVTATGDLSREAFYMQQALVAAGADGSAYEVEGVGGADLQSWDQARLDSHPAVVLLSTRGLDHRGRTLLADYARKGGGILIGAGTDVDGDVLSEALGGLKLSMAPGSTPGARASIVARTLALGDVRHPIFEALAGGSPLGLVTFKRVSTMRPADCQTLARFTTGEVALVDCSPGEGRALILASDLDNQGNDFPLHASFVPFLHGAIQYLSGTRRSSDYVVGRTPRGVAKEPGVARIASEGVSPASAARLIAINAEPAESEIGRLTPAEFQTAVTRLKDVAASEQAIEVREQEERQHVWQYVLALMIAMLVVESVVAMRTA